MYVCACMQVHVCVIVCVCVCAHMCMCVCMHASACECMCTCMHARVHTCRCASASMSMPVFERDEPCLAAGLRKRSGLLQKWGAVNNPLLWLSLIIAKIPYTTCLSPYPRTATQSTVHSGCPTAAVRRVKVSSEKHNLYLCSHTISGCPTAALRRVKVSSEKHNLYLCSHTISGCPTAALRRVKVSSEKHNLYLCSHTISGCPTAALRRVKVSSEKQNIIFTCAATQSQAAPLQHWGESRSQARNKT